MPDIVSPIDGRKAYFSRLIPQLREGGRLVIVDFKKDAPEDAPGPPPAMRVAQDVMVRELEGAGLRLRRADRDTLPHQYIVELVVAP